MLLLPVLTAVLALIDDAVQQRGSAPRSVEDVLALVLARWPEAAGAPLDEADATQVARMLAEAWGKQGRGPLSLGWGEGGEDPFRTKRAAVDLAVAWPHQEEHLLLTDRPSAFEAGPGDVRVAFPAVVKNKHGTWILPMASTGGSLVLARGQTLADAYSAASHPSPYWVVTRVTEEGAELRPLPPNPLLTGVGAGGATITGFDLDVLSGAHEQRHVSRKVEKLRNRTAVLDDVVYLLLGTVPLQFGPNGAQGGWYAPTDRSSRGGMQGLSPEEIEGRDARQLVRWGFVVPESALQDPPALPVSTWGEWLGGPPRGEGRAPNVPAYLAYLRQMTKRGIYRYDEESIRSLARKLDPAALQTWLTRCLALFLRDPARWKEAHPYGPSTLPAFISWARHHLEQQARDLAKEALLDIPGEDSNLDSSIAHHLYHPERRVSIRNAHLALHRAAIGTIDPRWKAWRGLLLDWVKSSRGDWLAYEAAIRYFSDQNDLEAVRLFTRLPDVDNRKYAIRALYRLAPEEAKAFLEKETSPAVWYAGWYPMAEAEGKAVALRFAIDAGWVDNLTRRTPDEADVVDRCALTDLAGTIASLTRELAWESTVHPDDTFSEEELRAISLAVRPFLQR